MNSVRISPWLHAGFCALVGVCVIPSGVLANPVNKKSLANHFEHLLPAKLNDCTTCHQPSTIESPHSLDEFPHNAFGDRLRKLGEELKAKKADTSIASRLSLVASEDADQDGADNLTELLLGTNPGQASQKPDASLLAFASAKRAAYEKHLHRYPWHPFQPVKRPAVGERRKQKQKAEMPLMSS